MQPIRCVTALAFIAAAGPVRAADAPLFGRPFSGVPVAEEDPYGRIVPAADVGWENDASRSLDPGQLPPRFSERTTTPSAGGMTVAGGFFGQFVDHDLTRTRLQFDELLLEPFVFRYVEAGEDFLNQRTPGLDLDNLYRISPLEYPSSPPVLGPWDASNLRFRLPMHHGAPDFFRGPSGIAVIGDERDDQNGVIAQVHRAFMKLHNVQVDRIIARDGIDEGALEFLGSQWWDIFNEARNYTTAYYQGIVANELAAALTGRTLFDALDDGAEPPGALAEPRVPVELAGCGFRLHTVIPVEVPVAPGIAVSPLDNRLRFGVSWTGLIETPAGRIDTAIAAPLRDVVNLVVPGTVFPITLDLAEVNVLRGREMKLPSGEEYLAHLLDELGLDPSASTVRGGQVLDAASAAGLLDPVDDAALAADLADGDTDLWAYVMLEAELNDGMLGPVGQDIFERTFLALLLADDWSLLGLNSDQFTPEQMAFFRSATLERLVDEIVSPADLDRSGWVGVDDMLALFAAWGASGSPADLDGDGTVGAGDLDALFAAWGE